MPQRKIGSPSSDGAHLVAPLLARIDRLLAQIAAKDERIDELRGQAAAQGPARRRAQVRRHGWLRFDRTKR